MPLLPWGGVGWGRRSCTAAGTEFSESESIAPAVLFSGALSLCSLRSAQGWLIHSAFAILLHRFLSPTSSLPPPQNVLCSARIPCSRTRRRPTLARDHLGPRKARDARKRPVRLVDVVPDARPQGWPPLRARTGRRRRPQEPRVQGASRLRRAPACAQPSGLAPRSAADGSRPSFCRPSHWPAPRIDIPSAPVDHRHHPMILPTPDCRALRASSSRTLPRPRSPSPAAPSSSAVSSRPRSPASTSS